MFSCVRGRIGLLWELARSSSKEATYTNKPRRLTWHQSERVACVLTSPSPQKKSRYFLRGGRRQYTGHRLLREQSEQDDLLSYFFFSCFFKRYFYHVLFLLSSNKDSPFIYLLALNGLSSF